MAIQLLVVGSTELKLMSYLWSKKEIDIDSGRNLKGVMERDIAEHHPLTIKAIIPPQHQEERQETLTLLDNSTLIVTLYNPRTGKEEQHIMMHGDLDSEIYGNWELEDGTNEILWKEFSIDLVEY